MASENASRAIKDAFLKAIPQKLEGHISGPVLLTPPTVNRLRDWSQYRSFGFFVPHSEFSWNPLWKSTTLEKWDWTDEYGKTVTSGIYQGGIEFPEFCCKCMLPATHYEVAELRVTQFSGGFTLPRGDQRTADLISDAVFCNRYWFAIPFCNEHSLKSRAIDFENSDRGIIFQFANKEYSKLFNELNKLEGVWLNRSSLVARALFKLSMFIASFIIIIGGLIIYNGLTNVSKSTDNGSTLIIVLLIGLAPLLLGLGLVIGSLYFRRKYAKGEKF
jgi:hypothetical protein